MMSGLSWWTILVVLLRLRLYAAAVLEVKTLCESGLCLALYTDTEGMTNDQSRVSCTDRDMEAAAITDASVQEMVERLLDRIPDVGDVWTAGVRLSEYDWRYLNGTVFTEYQSIINTVEGYCVHLQTRDDHFFYADQCNEHQGNSYPLCQYIPTESGSCITQGYEGILYKDTCYYVHNRQPGDGGWYDAQTFCHTQLEGDLAYTNFMDGDFITEVRKVNRDVWLGIRRHRWRWLAAAGRILPMRYFNWGSVFDESITNSRVAISSGDFTWKNIATSTRLKHFMCAYVDESHTTRDDTTFEQTPSTEPVRLSTETDESTTSTDSTAFCDSKPFHVTAVAASVSVNVVLLIAVAVLAVALSKSRSRNISGETHNAHMAMGSKVETITDVSSQTHVGITALGHNDVTGLTSHIHSGGQIAHHADSYETVSGGEGGRRAPSDGPYEGLREEDTSDMPKDNSYKVTNDAHEMQLTVGDATYEHPNGLRGVQVTPGDNPYESPSSYVNIVDKPSVYDSLHQ